jgi:hypothetical protein
MTSKEVMALINASIALNGAKNQLPEGLRIRKALNDSIIDGSDEEVGEDFVIIEETNERNIDGPKSAKGKNQTHLSQFL